MIRSAPFYDNANEAAYRLEVEQRIEGLRPQPVAPVSVSMAAAENDFVVSARARVLRVTPHASNTNLTGITGGTDQRELRLINVGSTNLVLKNQDAASVAENRLLSPTGADITLGANDVADLWYDATTARWRVVNVLT